jgi:hypothetical protein
MHNMSGDSEHDDEGPPGGGDRRRVLWTVLAVAALTVFVLLHLLGVFSPSSHG